MYTVSFFVVVSHLQIMNPFNLIGFFLVLFCGIIYANAVPIASDATNSAVTADNLTNERTNDEKLDNLLYNTDLIKSSENVSLDQQAIIELTTQKPHSETEKPKSKSRRRVKVRRRARTQRGQPDCKPPTTERPTTTKPTKLVILIPNLFISQSWGPGR